LREADPHAAAAAFQLTPVTSISDIVLHGIEPPVIV
jgi:hypothetical protein